MRRCLIILLAAIPVLVSAAMSPEELVSSAERAEKSGSFQSAIDLYTEFIKTHADHIQRPVVEFKLGLCYDAIGRSVPAIQHLLCSVEGPADKMLGKHRPEALMKIARLYADENKHADAAKALETLLKEGAGLYEDEAQSLRGSYLALLGKYEDSSMLFNILRNKQSSEYAKDAGYKLSVVWLKAGNLEFARVAIDEFAQRFPGDSRLSDLYIRLARALYEKKLYKSASEICQRMLSGFKDAPETMEAAFVVALCYRDNGAIDKAIESLLAMTKMPQGAHNSVLLSEAYFEVAQLYRKQLKQNDKAMECYAQAIAASKDVLTERQQGILEQSLFFSGEICLQRQQWQAAYDFYALLRETGTKISVLERMIYCKGKMGGLLDAFKDIKEEDLAFIQKRIDEYPGKLEALQAEVFLLEFRQVVAQKSSRRDTTKKDATAWPELSPFIAQYETLLTKYPADVLRQKDQGTYIKLRQAGIYLHAPADHPDVLSLTTKGFNLCERVLAEAPESAFRIEAIEKLALLAQRSGQGAKAFDAYQKLFALTETDPEVAARRPPVDYLDGLVGTVINDELAGGAIATMDRVITSGRPATNAVVRQAYFYRAELNAMRRQYATAALQLKEFVKIYGPPQDAKGAVLATWDKPKSADAVYVQVCDAAQRAGQCWTADNNTTNALESYRWAAENLNHLNPRVAEAWHMVLMSGVQIEKLTPDKKEELARNLWTRIVNPSIDIGSKAFKGAYYPWVRDPGAVPFVQSAMLKAGQYFAEGGKHKLAGDVFKEYVVIYQPDPKPDPTVVSDPEALYDKQYAIASYGAGKEYLLAADQVAAVERFRVFIDHMRTSTFRIPALMAVGYYGTERDMYEDATAAYGALLDEYGPSNPMDPYGLPVPVSKDERLRKDGNWDGIRRPLPPKWDAGKMRSGLGYIHWKRENWVACQAALAPFVDDKVLRSSDDRAKSMFMLAQCHERLYLPTKAIKVMESVIKEYPKYEAIEEVYATAARLATGISEWPVVTDLCTRYVAAFPNGQRRAHMDFYAAVAQVGSGKTESGVAALRQLAESDTYADVKGGAYYHLAMQIMRDPKGDKAAAFALLRKSVDNNPDAVALLQAAKCACDVKNWTAAREFLDKFGQNFPKADRGQLDEAQLLRRRIVQESTAR